MNLNARKSPIIIDPLTAARHARSRYIKDILTRHIVGIGGVSVIIAVLLIAFYLFVVVLPLFIPARIHHQVDYPSPGGAGVTTHLIVDEQNEVGVRVSDNGQVVFFRLKDGTITGEQNLPHPTDTRMTGLATDNAGHFVLGWSDGSALLASVEFTTTFPPMATTTDTNRPLERVITPTLSYPLGETPLVVDEQGQALLHLALSADTENFTLVATTADHRLIGATFARHETLMGDVQVEREGFNLGLSVNIEHLLLSFAPQLLYAIASDGKTAIYDFTPGVTTHVQELVNLTPPGVEVTATRLLLGDTSLIVGGSDGSLTQWFPVRGSDNRHRLTRIRAFDPLPNAIRIIVAAQRMKSFAAWDASGQLGFYHATAHRTLLQEKILSGSPQITVLSPRGNSALWEDNHRIQVYQIENEYPEISWSSLWEKVWYEGRAAAKYIWQSSAATTDFEPKMSLVPLTFGTLKAAFYAMLIAVPVGILGAIYTAYFMSAPMRSFVKPTIEIMGAMPSVILGFLAGLWLAPIMEKNLPGIVALLVFLPLGIFLSAWIWSRLPQNSRMLIPEGWEAALLIPVILLAAFVALEFSNLLEVWLFNGDARYWLTSHGIPFNQRNSLVVSISMGFAVAPLIFSIAEDAIFAVPRHLTLGSLALGATLWQTMTRVVLLTASPGIFSAIMIGLGRAVGETMIMLMATGNTPVTNFNIFEGFRALSANIAVEMPEAELNSTHYRVLFLTALALFLFTFILNTLAEVIRQRLRRRYSSL